MGSACTTRVNSDEIDPSRASRTVASPEDEPETDIPSPVKQLIDAKKQRRRLSVTTKHVGAISKLDPSRKMSMVTANHLKDNDKTFVSITKTGFVPYNKDKVNQDAYFFDINLEGGCKMFGVADGHGEFGHNVSAIVQRKLPRYIEAQDYQNDPDKAMLHATAKIAKLLKKSTVNTTFSGTTLVYSLFVKGEIITGNLGDSRAVVCYFDEATGTMKGKALSRDHKPDDDDEQARIIDAGGRIAPLPGPVGEDCGPNRVWLADIDVPGLAMSRSLGDDVAHSVGVSSVPEILRHTITKNDQFVIWASDGVWEFIADDEAAVMVSQHLPNLNKAATQLVNESVARWQKEEDVIDDITAIIYKLPPFDDGDEEEPAQE